MDNIKSKLKTSWPYLLSLVVYIVIIPAYAFKEPSEINVFGKIAIFCAMISLAINTVSIVLKFGNLKGLSKTLLNVMSLTVFAIFTYFIVVILT